MPPDLRSRGHKNIDTKSQKENNDKITNSKRSFPRKGRQIQNKQCCSQHYSDKLFDHFSMSVKSYCEEHLGVNQTYSISKRVI